MNSRLSWEQVIRDQFFSAFQFNHLSQETSSTQACVCFFLLKPDCHFHFCFYSRLHFVAVTPSLLFSHRMSIRESVVNEASVSSLNIESVERKDSGLYSCRAANAFGSDETSIQLVVQGAFAFVPHSHSFFNHLLFFSNGKSSSHALCSFLSHDFLSFALSPPACVSVCACL